MRDKPSVLNPTMPANHPEDVLLIATKFRVLHRSESRRGTLLYVDSFCLHPKRPLERSA